MFEEAFSFELNWDTNAARAVRDLDQIENKIDSVGSTADKAAGRLRSGLGSNLFSGLGQGVSNITGQLKGVAGEAMSTAGAMTPLGGAINGAGLAMGGLAVGVAAVGAALVAGAFAAGRMGDAIQDAADSIAISTDAYQTWRGSVALAGGEAEAFDKAVTKLNVNIGNAAQGDKAAAGKFDALGISLRNNEGALKSNETLLGEVRDKLSEVESAEVRLAMANDLLGKGSKDMIGVLSMSKAEFDALQKNVSKYGVASAAALQQVGKLGDGMDYLGGAVSAGVINSFAPLTNALGTLAMNAVPLVGEAFKVLGGIIDFLAGVGSVLGDGLKLLWDLFVKGAQFIGNLFPVFGRLGQWLNVTGENSLSLRERWAITMGDMIKFAGAMVGRIAGFFATLSANTHNIIAGIKNALVDSGIGKLIGVDGKMEIKDSRAAGAAASAGARAGFDAAGDAFTSRYRGAGNRRDAAAPPSTSNVPAANAGSGSSSGKASESEAEKATKKYEEAVARLNQAKAELNLTDEQRRLLDEMEKAGLERNIELIGQRADAIRALVSELQGMEQQKKINEAIAEYQKAVVATTLSEDELVRVEARRRAGLTEDLSITSESIRLLEESALAADKAAKSKEKLREAEALLKDMQTETRDLEYELREMRASDIEVYDLRLERIEAEREAEEERLRQQYAELDVLEKLIEANNRRAEAQRNVVKQDKADANAEKALDNVEKMADTLEGMWTDWRGTMKQVLGEFVKELLVAIAKATILKSIMKDTTMGGGSGGGGLGSILAQGVMSIFGGGRGAGGAMSAGTPYIVSPGEKFIPATDGYMLSAGDLRGMQRGGRGDVHLGGQTFIIQGGGDQASTLAQLQEVENNFRNIVRDEMQRAS